MNKADVCEAFSIADFDGIVVAGNYKQESYEGSAAVLFVDDGKLFWVSGSHCSCFGLENQWSPEEVTIEQVRHIAARGYGTEQEIAEEAIKILETFGMPTDPDAISAAVQLYFGHRE